MRDATDDDLAGAVAVELVHQASLYHDDVIDEAVMRRKVESVNSRWGNLVAIVAGDFLLARSAEIAAVAGPGSGRSAGQYARPALRGQLVEIRFKFSTERTEADYFEAIAGKTSALMATSCRVGAITSGRTEEEIESLTRFGSALGMVFQIRDDVLDVIGTEKDLGKPVGQDLAEGIYTLARASRSRGRDLGTAAAAASRRPAHAGPGRRGAGGRLRIRSDARDDGGRPALRRGGRQSARRVRPPRSSRGARPTWRGTSWTTSWSLRCLSLGLVSSVAVIASAFSVPAEASGRR